MEKVFEYLHTSRENQSIYSRRLHNSLESVVRENVKCEIGKATPQFQQLARKYIENCMVCVIVRQWHPDKSRGSRVPLTLKGKSYENVSIETLGFSKVKLSKGTRNLLWKNQVLAVCCLSSGHLLIQPVESLTPNSIAGALWRIEESFQTRITSIWSDNHPSLGQSSLAKEFEKFQCFRVSVDEVIRRTPDVTFCMNISFTKSRNYIDESWLCCKI